MTYTYEIAQDRDPMSPRDDDTLSRIVMFHKKFDFPNEDGYNSNDYEGWHELAADIGKNSGTHILPIYMFEHGGIEIKATKGTNPYTCGWDSGQVGFVYTNADLIEYFGVDEGMVDDYLIGEVEIYSRYVSGEVYAYHILDENGIEVDYCGGFYDEEYAEIEAQSTGYIMQKVAVA